VDFYEVLSRRRSVREFQSRPVEAGKLQRVLEAGLRHRPTTILENGSSFLFKILGNDLRWLKQELRLKT
jgi:hypothetical protein